MPSCAVRRISRSGRRPHREPRARSAELDNVIIERVAEVAKRYETSKKAVSLAWLLTKVTSPVVGATKPHHLEGPAAAADLVLAPEDIAYLEEPYVPHALVGVMAQRR